MIKIAFLPVMLVLLTSSAFSQFVGPRNSAMGGIGVATSDFLNAGFVNPALLTQYDRASDDDWGLLLPAIDIYAADEDELIDATENFADTFDLIDEQIDLGNNPTQPELDALAASLDDLDNKTAVLDFGAGFSIGIPSKSFGAAVLVRGNVGLEARPIIDPADVAAIQGALGAPDLPTLSSEFTVLAAGMTEIGLALAREFEFGGRAVSIGLTPKMQTLEVFNYAVAMDDADDIEDDFDADIYSDDDMFFNVDLGATMDLTESVRVGAVVRNLMENSVMTPLINGREYTYTVEPEATVGVAWHSGPIVLGVDYDVTSRSTFDEREGSRFARAGVEFGAKWAQLRVGVSTDLEDVHEDLLTGGIGLAPFGVLHVDLGGAVGDNAYAANLGISLTF